MEHLVRDPALRTRVYHLKAEGMAFKVTVALRARRVEKWIRGVTSDFLDAAMTKCVTLDCEFTDPRVVLKDFLQDRNIRLCGVAIGNDVKMLSLYGIRITSAYDLQKVVPNPTTKPTPSLYDLANYTIGTNLEKKKKKKYNKKMMDVAPQEKEDYLIF
ncbi:uncharacterized protein [Lolium perenne]|uniref:uncharacterized protein n=1 Tax=Lolium perenne TaxID=4522 RepID=UPI0021F59797|nr:uncharacterized protein LOC127340523 [Lolium perenne]